jgi:D-alanyl-D-alanine dipeptidase
MSEIHSATLLFLELCSMCMPAGSAAPKSPPPGFVRLADVAPTIVQDMRYASADNFTGRPVPGYKAGQCWLRREVALALAAAQKDAEAQGLSLIVYDCYRPERATKAFVVWAQDATDQAMKQAFYPRIDKSALFEQGYISKTSTHSLGIAVDLGFISLDFGTPFDLFDATSSTKHPQVDAAAKANREKLLVLMRKHGFENFEKEWWHFTFKGVDDAKPLDVEIE